MMVYVAVGWCTSTNRKPLFHPLTRMSDHQASDQHVPARSSNQRTEGVIPTIGLGGQAKLMNGGEAAPDPFATQNRRNDDTTNASQRIQNKKVQKLLLLILWDAAYEEQ